MEVNLLKESTYQTPCGTIHYWSSILRLDTTTLVFLPGLTADHRLFDKQVEHFVKKYNIIVCGQCVKNCPMNNIVFENGKPIWGNQCTHCMACNADTGFL